MSAHTPPHPLLHHTAFVRALARGLLARAADDLAQDTMLAALEHPPASPGTMRAWLAKVARNLASNARRGERRRLQREQATTPEQRHDAPDAIAERLELARTVADSVLALPEIYRTVIYLRFHEGLPPAAIARRLDVPVKTVKTRLSRALAELRGKLDRHAGDRARWSKALAVWVMPWWSLGAFAGTGIVMKKSLAAIAAVCLLWFGVRALWPSPSPAASNGAGAAGGSEIVAPASAPAPRAATPRTPIAAPVRAPASTGRGNLRVRMRWSNDHTPAGEVGVDATAHADDAPRAAFLHQVSDPHGEVNFTALAAGQVLLHTSLGHRFDAEVAADATREIDVTLAHNDHAEGVVVAPDGSPVGGATIWSYSGGGYWPSRPLTTSAADGRFRVRGLEGHTEIGARARGYAPSLMFEVRDLPASASGVRTITLQLGAPGGRVAGCVRSPAGAPIAHAEVKVGAKNGHIVDLPSGLRATAPVPVPIATDAAGLFEVPHDFAAGEVAVRVAAHGFGVWAGAAAVVAGERTFVDVQLEAPARVLGRVVLPDGTPVAGARVLAARETGGGWYHDEFSAPRATSRADGTFVLDWVAPGEQEVNAFVEDNPRLGRARATVACVAGEATQAELVLDVGATITGRVLDRDGRPLAGWTVFADPTAFGQIHPRQDRTDEDGAFLLANLGDCTWSLLVAAPGEFPHPPRASKDGVRTNTRDLDLVVADTRITKATLTGRVLDEREQVPRDVRVTVWDERNDAGLYVDIDPVTGAFTHTSTQPGRYEARVMRGGQTIARSGEVAVKDGATADLGILRVRALATVTLDVRGAAPAQLAALRVVLESPHHATESLARDGARYTSRGVAAGTWVLRARGAGVFVADREVTLLPGDAHALAIDVVQAFEVPLTVQPVRDGWRSLALEVRSARGELLRREAPHTRRHGGGASWEVPDLSLPAGPCVLTVTSDDGQQGFTTLDVGPQSRQGGTLHLR